MPQNELWFAVVALGLAVLLLNLTLMAARRRWLRLVQECNQLKIDNVAAWEQAQYYRVQYEDMELRQRHLDQLHRRQVNDLQKALTVVQESSAGNRHNESI